MQVNENWTLQNTKIRKKSFPVKESGKTWIHEQLNEIQIVNKHVSISNHENSYKTI